MRNGYAEIGNYNPSSRVVLLWAFYGWPSPHRLGHELKASIAPQAVVSWLKSSSSALNGNDPPSPESTPSSAHSESLLAAAENAYNPIPSPDGTKIAYVRTGWGRGFVSSMGRSNLRSEIMVMDSAGRILTEKPLAEAFLSGWTAHGKQLIGYRNWESFLLALDGTRSEYTRIPESIPWADRPERVTYFASFQAMLWVLRTDRGGVIRTLEKTMAWKNMPLREMLMPSPDERYLATIGDLDEALWVYDIQRRSWAKLGRVTIHPDRDWDYIRPVWNPWFADSSRLAFISGSTLMISSPDGRIKQRITRLNKAAGLAVPSPDGRRIAYATFEPTPRKEREDLTFWGNTTVWVAPTTPGTPPRPVTEKVSETTYDIRWLNNAELVFDRLADERYYKNVRLWKAMVPEP